MSNTPHVRIVDAAFEPETAPAPASPPPLNTPPDMRAAQAKLVKEIAVALAPVAAVAVAGFAFWTELDALWKHAKKNARRRTEGGR